MSSMISRGTFALIMKFTLPKLVAILFLGFPFFGISQSYINKPYQKVENAIRENEFKKFSLKPVITTKDSVIIFSAENPPCPSIKVIYRFDELKKCKSEELNIGCQDYFTKLLTRIIENKQYNWIKINENQYVSDFDSGLMIEIPPDNSSFSFKILRMNWSRELYDLLMKN